MPQLTESLPQLAITLGDPTGIGPEVVLKALADLSWQDTCRCTVVGNREVLQHLYQQLVRQGHSDLCDPSTLDILEPEAGWGKFQPGQPSAASGAASFAYVDTALTGVRAGQFDGVVTGPIAKSWWQQAGHDYPGQTELCAHHAQAESFGMMFVAQSPHTQWKLCTLLATTHIPLAQVPQQLTPSLMTQKLDLLVQCLSQDFGQRQPTIAIAGLNPHSGEQGRLGQEEVDWLIPWMDEMEALYPQVTLLGPIPPDTMWVKPGQAWYGPQPQTELPDAYLALYHDQGLIPVKLMAFDRAVNTTIGLPFIRTSPDHGTAFDIAGKGMADATSMKAALDWAIYFIKQRRPFNLSNGLVHLT